MNPPVRHAILVAALFLAMAGSARADLLLDSYVAYLSDRDHFSSTGQRLTSAAAIIRQDRANFHRFGRRDSADEGDSYFGSAANREILERLLKRGNSSRAAIQAVVNGTPFVLVHIFRSDDGHDYVTVSVSD